MNIQITKNELVQQGLWPKACQMFDIQEIGAGDGAIIMIGGQASTSNNPTITMTGQQAKDLGIEL